MLSMGRFAEREINAVSVVVWQKGNNQLFIYQMKGRGQDAQIKMMWFFCWVLLNKIKNKTTHTIPKEFNKAENDSFWFHKFMYPMSKSRIN